MSIRYEAGILSATYQPLRTPNAPTIGTATAGGGQVSITFTAPADIGGGAITLYRAYVTNTSTGAITTNTGATSPIVVTGLTNGTGHTARVTAINSFGEGPQSAVSNSATPVVQGQFAYTVVGSYSWVAPAEVTSVSVVAVGGGAGNAGGGDTAPGGGLGWKNNISVTPGQSYTVVVGRVGPNGYNAAADYNNGGTSYFNLSTIVSGEGARGFGATGGKRPGTYVGDGGGNGGNGGYASGGGAGGYTGNGGNGIQSQSVPATAGSGGGGGGGTSSWGSWGPGGGVGILGQGANGAAGGGAGSGGSGPMYGGGGGNSDAGGSGAVRIIWPGTTRQFPSTGTANV
jgi:hypothetical protein